MDKLIVIREKDLELLIAERELMIVFIQLIAEGFWGPEDLDKHKAMAKELLESLR